MSILSINLSGLAVAGILQAATVTALVNRDLLADHAGIGAIRLPRAEPVETAALPEWLASSAQAGAAPAEDAQRAAALQAIPPFATFLVRLSTSSTPR